MWKEGSSTVSQNEMRMLAILNLVLLVIVAGCSNCASNNSRHNYLPTPGKFGVFGEVKQSGYIDCKEIKSNSLTGLIAHCGGFTDSAYARKILVIYNGTTNRYDVRKIQSAEGEDPVVPCGALVLITRIAPPF
jgi:hypothetical protein